MNINELLPNPADDQLKATIKNALVSQPLQLDDQELNLDTISSNRELSELGALAGDKIVNGELVRVWSNPEDATNFGTTLTEADIFWNKDLQELDAKPGDRLVDGKLIDSKADEAMTQFKYGWESTESLTGMGIDILNAAMPLAGDTEKYGEEFEKASFDRRAELIQLFNQRKLQEEFDPYTLHQMQQQGTDGWSTAGSLLAGLADPLALTPIGRTVKAGITIGGAYGGAYSVAEDISQGKDVDLSKLLMTTTAGGAFGAGANKLTNMLKKTFSEKQSKAANTFLDNVETQIETKIATGVSPRIAKKEVFDEVGINNIQQAQVITNRTGDNVLKKIRDNKKKVDAAVAEDSAVARVSSGALDKYLGAISTRIRNISEPIFGRMRKFEADLHFNTHNRLKLTDGYVSGFMGLDKNIQRQIGLHLANGRRKEALGLMPDSLKNEFGKVTKVLDDMNKELKATGHKYTAIKDYYPRRIKNFKEFSKALGLPKGQMSQLEKALDTYASRTGKIVNDLTDSERSEVTDMFLRGFIPKKGKGRKLEYVQERTINEVNPAIYDFYENPAKALQDYIRKGTHDIEKRKFFGKNAVTDGAGMDTVNSIGKFMTAEGKGLNTNQQNELTELIRARFIGGEQSPSGFASAIRDAGYMGTIANPLSAIVQLGDLAVSAALNGLKNTLAGLFGKKYMKLADIGIDQVLSEELANPRTTGQILNKMFKYSGFRSLDRLGKETIINASIRKAFNQVKTPAGEKAFRQKWGKIYGDEIDSMVASMKNRTIDDNIKLHAFNELSDMQPISLLEMPQGYLEAKNGRLLYMLKTYTLKQWDVVRRNVIQEFKTGNKMKAIKNMAVLGAYLTAANTGTQVVRDFLQGREVKPEDIPGRALWALLSVYGANQYTTERYFANGKVKEGFVNMVLPATPIIDAAFGATADAAKQLSDMQSKSDWAYEAPNYGKHLKPVPIVGNLTYQWFLGGAELWNEKEEGKRRKQRREELYQ